MIMLKNSMNKIKGVFLLIPFLLSSCSNNQNKEDAKLKKDIASDFYDQILIENKYDAPISYVSSGVHVEDGKLIRDKDGMEITKESIQVPYYKKINDCYLSFFISYDFSLGGKAGWFTSIGTYVDDFVLCGGWNSFPYIWKDGTIYSVHEAYEKSLVNKDDFQSSFKIKNTEVLFGPEAIDDLSFAKNMFLSSIIKAGKIEDSDSWNINVDDIHISKHYLHHHTNKWILSFSVDEKGGKAYEGKTTKLMLGEKEYEFLGEWSPYVFYKNYKNPEESYIKPLDEAYRNDLIGDEELSLIGTEDDNTTWFTYMI